MHGALVHGSAYDLGDWAGRALGVRGAGRQCAVPGAGGVVERLGVTSSCPLPSMAHMHGIYQQQKHVDDGKF